MFARNTFQSVRRARGARTLTTSPILKRFDKSILYPTLLVVLLGSQIMNVMNAQKSCEDLDRRYNMKITKIDEIKERLQKGEKVDVENELKLVNRLFVRQNDNPVLKSTSTKFGSQFDGIKRENTADGNHTNVLSELDGEVTDDKLNKLFGLEPTPAPVSKKEVKAPKKETKPLPVLTKEEIKENTEREKELLNYRLEPNRHVVVENPGDYVSAAKDTKVSGFL